MRISATLEDWYEPAWNGNGQLSIQDRIRVRFRWPEHGYESRLTGVELNKEGQVTVRGYKAFLNQVVALFVIEVKGLEIGQVAITTGEALCALPSIQVTEDTLGTDGKVIQRGLTTWDLVEEIASHIVAGQGLIGKKKPLESDTGSS